VLGYVRVLAGGRVVRRVCMYVDRWWVSVWIGGYLGRIFGR
jgi:hypothetical protein